MRSRVVTRGISALQQQLRSGSPTVYDAANSVALKQLGVVSAFGSAETLARQQSNAAAGTSSAWEELKLKGVPVNPCQSPHHPAVAEGVVEPEGEELSVQEAYHPESQCFGCGPAAPDGLRLQSFRMPGGGLGRLEARLRFEPRYCAFPGIVNGGVLSTVMDCHGNWAAAIALMDKGCLPRPPLTLTASMEVKYHEPTPPDTELLLRSRVISIRDTPGLGALRTSVEVELELLLPPHATYVPLFKLHTQAGPEGEAGAAAAEAAKRAAGAPGSERLLASARGVFKRTGALRAM